MRISWIVVFALVLGLTAPAMAADLLLLRDGSRRTGDLQSCVGDQCRLNGQPVARSSIAWIGFRNPAGPPPTTPQPDSDSVHLVNGTTHVSPVVGISLGEVATAEAGYARSEVAWVHFTGPAGETEIPAPEPTPPPPPLGNGALWVGTLTGLYQGTVDGVTSRLEVTVSVRLREVKTSPLLLPPSGREIGTLVQLEPEGTTVTARFTSTDPYGSCSGQGTTTVTAEPGDAPHLHPSVIWKKTTASVDATALLGFDIPAGPASLYQVGINVPSGVHFVYTCSHGGGSSQVEGGYIIPAMGRSPLQPPGPVVDPELRYLQDGGTRMKGSYTAAATGAFVQVEASWDVVRSAP